MNIGIFDLYLTFLRRSTKYPGAERKNKRSEVVTTAVIKWIPAGMEDTERRLRDTLNEGKADCEAWQQLQQKYAATRDELAGISQRKKSEVSDIAAAESSIRILYLIFRS